MIEKADENERKEVEGEKKKSKCQAGKDVSGQIEEFLAKLKALLFDFDSDPGRDRVLILSTI